MTDCFPRSLLFSGAREPLLTSRARAIHSLGQQFGDLIGDHRLMEVKPLSFRTALLLQKCTLPACFDPFCHDSHAQALAHVDHRAHDAGIVRISR
jgi:hypothetical protein